MGTDTAKDYLHARWGLASGPGAVHFSHELPDSYFKGLVAEFRRSGFKKGRRVTWWEQKKGEPNEPLDLMNYNLAAAHYLGLHRKSEHAWNVLRSRLVSTSMDLFETVPAEPAPPPAVPVVLPQPSAAEATPASARPVQTLAPAPAALAPNAPPPAPSQRLVVGGRISLAALRRGAA